MQGTVAPTAHSRIGASSFYRWSACPGSVHLSKGIPSKSSAYAEEGTRAHEFAAIRLTKGSYPPGVESEMVEHLEVYVKAVEEAAFGCGKLIEHQFDLSSVHPGLFGTCDAVVFDKDEKTLRVFDLKYGAGIPVEVVENGQGNPQLMYYGLGALLSTGFPCEAVELVIVQPRCPHPAGAVRRWKFPAIEMLDFAADLKGYAERTEDEKAPVVPGEHCRFCPAAGVCAVVRNKAQALAKKEFLPVDDKEILPLAAGDARSVTLYDPKQLAETLSQLDMVEGWAKAVRDFAYTEANRGVTIPGWKLVEKRKVRKWADEKEAAEFLAKEFPNASIFDSPSLKSVAQIEKILEKKQYPKLAPLISATSSGCVLVPESDPRPAVVVLDAKSEFSKIE